MGSDITLPCNGRRHYGVLHSKILTSTKLALSKSSIKVHIIVKNSTTGCSFSKPAPASTNGYWFSGCHLTSLILLSMIWVLGLVSVRFGVIVVFCTFSWLL